MDEALIDRLSKIGRPTELHRNPDGSTALILPYGGRVLGLYAPGSDVNFFWTNPALRSEQSARLLYRSGEWHNSGGDRTWLAPEVDFFFPDYPNRDRYWQPRELDPGGYELVRTPEGPRLVNRLRCVMARTKAAVELEIGKSIFPAPDPLRRERAGREELASLEYAGYTLHTSLVILGETGPRRAAVGAWNLAQMPHGGELLVPTYSRTEPRVVFGAIPVGDLAVGDRLVRYRMRSAGDHKISIRAVATAGRAGYIYPSGDAWALVIRNIFVNPSGEYVDCPWDDPDDSGYSIQACSVNNAALGAFGELEYHVPAVGSVGGGARSDDWSAVWAYRGPRELIRRAAGILLTSDAEVKL